MDGQGIEYPTTGGVWARWSAALTLAAALGGCAMPAPRLASPEVQPRLSSPKRQVAQAVQTATAPVQPVGHSQPLLAFDEDADVGGAAAPLPETPALGPDVLPIDLVTAFQLAGANNLQIAVARERIREAQSRRDQAAVQWLPSLQMGVGYNYHDGTVQTADGRIINTSRNALFYGGGPNLGPGPLTGPGGPPARLFLGVPLADVLFPPLAERQETRAAQAASVATFNDTLLEVSLAYLALVQAQGDAAIAQEAADNAQELLRLVETNVRAGTAPPADEFRARVELAERQRQRLAAEESAHVASAELVRLLRLDPGLTVFPLEGEPGPVRLVAPDSPLPELLSQGLRSRPELAQNQALVQATIERMRQENWRPWLPNLQVGMSGGGFGGGQGSHMGDFSGRADFDALVVWDVQNLGLGNRARQRERRSQHRQANMDAQAIMDQVAAEVATAYHQVRFRQQQLEVARTQVEAADEALPLNLQGVLGGDLRPIEAQQAIQGLADARQRYLAAVVDHNRAQFELLRALGQPPSPAAWPEK